MNKQIQLVILVRSILILRTNYNMNDEEKSLSHYNIGDILITKSGDVLVGTSDGLNIYNPELSI